MIILQVLQLQSLGEAMWSPHLATEMFHTLAAQPNRLATLWNHPLRLGIAGWCYSIAKLLPMISLMKANKMQRSQRKALERCEISGIWCHNMVSGKKYDPVIQHSSYRTWSIYRWFTYINGDFPWQTVTLLGGTGGLPHDIRHFQMMFPHVPIKTSIYKGCPSDLHGKSIASTLPVPPPKLQEEDPSLPIAVPARGPLDMDILWYGYVNLWYIIYDINVEDKICDIWYMMCIYIYVIYIDIDIWHILIYDIYMYIYIYICIDIWYNLMHHGYTVPEASWW